MFLCLTDSNEELAHCYSSVNAVIHESNQSISLPPNSVFITHFPPSGKVPFQVASLLLQVSIRMQIDFCVTGRMSGIP